MTTTASPAAESFVPANRLTASPRNARKGPRRRIPELADSILAEGLLQNLVVSRDGEDYPVEAGERRRLAINHLISRGDLPEDWPVRVIVIDLTSSTAASAVENVHREVMHPADQYEAFTKLTEEGWTIDRIGHVFGVTSLVVERCLALRAAAPALLEMFRADEITAEQLAALCATDDHERQESAWRNAYWNRDPISLRRAVLAGDVETDRDPRVAFIGGPEAFQAAGGYIRRDLFSGEGQHGLISDIPLLDRLVVEKLEAEAGVVRTEGWGWVDVWPAWNYTEFHRLGRIRKTKVEFPDVVAEEMAALADEHASLAELTEAISEDTGVDDPTEADSERYAEACARMEEIEARVKSVETAHTSYDPAAMATAGAVVGIERGTLRIERGLVKPEDRATTAEAVGGGAAIAGGRETEVAGRRKDALSDALTRSLLGHRNLGAQVATAANPHVAKVFLACWTVQTLRGQRHAIPTDLLIQSIGHGTRTMHPITDDTGPGKQQAFEAIGEGLIASFPNNPEALWDALMDLSADDLDALIAFGVASSVSLDREHRGLTERLLTALGFDVADHFTTSAPTYLSRVSKALIVDALTQAELIADDQERTALLAMKKGDLVARAEAMLAPTRWVPEIIRTPGVTVATAAAPEPDSPSTPTETAPAPDPDQPVAEAPATTLSKKKRRAKGPAGVPPSTKSRRTARRPKEKDGAGPERIAA